VFFFIVSMFSPTILTTSAQARSCSISVLPGSPGHS
jgi:hypothetical protein